MAIVVPFVGAAIGSALLPAGFLGVSGASIGYFAGSLLGSALFKPPAQQGPRLGDLSIVGTDYGQAIPWVAGSPRLASQYIWVSPLREIANTQKVGKGGGQKVTQYTYECDVMLLVTENITEDVARDWINAELVRNGLNLKAGIASAVTVYTGEIDQDPDPTYEAAVGVGNAPAYRGHTTIVITGLQLGNGKSLPNFEHQVNTVGGQDLSGVLIDAPLNSTTTNNDLAPDPLDATVVGENVVYEAERVVLGPTGDSVQFIGSKAALETYPLSARLYMAFDYAVTATSGSSLPGDLQVFFSLPTGEPGQIRWLLQYQADGSLSLVGQNFYVDAAADGTINNFPEAGRIAFVWEAGVDNRIDIYLNNVLVGNARNAASTMRDAVSIALLVASGGTLLGKYASRVAYGRFFFGIGVDPVYGPSPEETLGSAIRKLMSRASYLDTQFEVDVALDEVPLAGYAASSVTSTRAHLETMRPYGLYECNCSDRIYIFPRATTAVGTIPWADLGASESFGDPADPFPLQVGNETEVPAQIAVRYRNVDADWNIGTEFSDRLVSSQQSTQVVEMPFGLTPTQAKRIADTMLKDAMAGLGRAVLRVAGRKYAKFAPGDVLTTTAPDGSAYRFRIITKRDFIFMLEWEVALDDAGALDSPAITYTGYVSTDQPATVAPTLWEVMPIRPLRDADASEPGPYVAIAPQRLIASDEWPGGVFVRARLPEAFEQQFISGDACVVGTCLNTLGDYAGGSGQVQRTGKLRVQVRGELSTADYYDFFTDRTINAAVVGGEPIRFMTAEFIETDGVVRTYDLYNFLRGQLGMEDQIGGHGPGERFVLLNNSVRRMVNETSDIGAEQQVKAVTLNFRLDDVAEREFTDDGIALRPLSPVRLRALADAGDLDFTWIRRSRLLARWTTSGVIAPLGEAFEQYRIKVYADPDVDPVRTVIVASPAWTYAAADQASDGFTAGDPITVTVQQLSELVGEGDAVTLEAEAP